MKFTRLARLGLATLMVGILAACGGGGGGGSTTAVTPPPGGGGGGGGGGTTTPTVAVPTGTAPVTLSATTAAATWTALTPTVPAVVVSINSPPKITFSLTDGHGNAIIGIGAKSQSATATLATYQNIKFTLAKLVPGSNGSPSKWINYNVMSVPTYTSATDKTIVASVPAKPTNDATGTLVDNGNGTYEYTFWNDVTTVKDRVAAAAETATNKNADLGDLSYDKNAVHRLVIQISGDQPGTNKNTPDGSTSSVAAVTMANPINVVYDFIPATGKAVTATDPSRDIVATAKCNECHNKIGTTTPHGGRVDTRYCVVCHNDQRKYGRAEAATTATGYTSAAIYRTDGNAVGNFPVFIHRLHGGEVLSKTNSNYAGIMFAGVTYPQDIRNCTKCHDGSDTSTAKTANGDNWKQVPSRLVCGTCHDGISFATGKGVTLADAAAGKTSTTIYPGGTAHGGGAQLDDSACNLCHKSTAIPVYHIPVTPPDPLNALSTVGGNTHSYSESIAGNQNNLPAGAIKVSWDIKSVSRNASKQPVIVFRFLQNGTAVPFNDKATKTEIWNNFFGAPSIYFVWAEPQDGIAKPADFNKSASTWFKTFWNGTATGAKGGTLSTPDSSGYYTATLTGVTVPDTAVMLTGGIGYSYGSGSQPLTQANVDGYPVTASPVTPTLNIGGLAVVATNANMVATSYTGRRTIVSNDKCNKCHENLGVFTASAFHSGQRNDAPTCSWCHNPGRTSGGWAVDSTAFVHAIHASSKRTVQFNWTAASATSGFFDVGYPGILKECETCHLPGTYDFSASASASALPNRLYRSVGSGDFSAASAISTSPYVLGNAAANDLVNSPITTACFSCHDDSLAVGHMKSNGGSLYVTRSAAIATAEQCTLCHLSGKVADIKTMHAQ